MAGLFSLCIVLSFTYLVNGETTTPAPHQHHEHTEMESFSFHYDGASQLMLVMVDTKCYIWTLTHKQLQGVHTDDGLRAIELKVLGDIKDALYTVVPKVVLASSIQHGCGRHADSFYIVH
ncbi:uncharacterized protein LOC132757823 [Ruditapes philippinarum]|uniref:uncharacterized protein LOC132757823 n=1 Tax=Ruditapes philippinarum TaxID=129788 RepID=UPI00295BD77D|nr:uncharacterized protein LOC132757823 [Ruditapes philippinarum]